jgi:hypothetical protein
VFYLPRVEKVIIRPIVIRLFLIFLIKRVIVISRINLLILNMLELLDYENVLNVEKNDIVLILDYL